MNLADRPWLDPYDQRHRSAILLQLFQQLLGRDAFLAVGFRESLLEFGLKVPGQTYRRISLPGENGDRGAFGKRGAIEHDFSIDDGAGDDVHGIIVARARSDGRERLSAGCGDA